MLSVLLAVLSLASAQEFPRFERSEASRQLDDRRRRAGGAGLDSSIASWEGDLAQRIARVEVKCLAALADKKCSMAGAYDVGERKFRYDPDASFDQAERYYDLAQYWKAGRQLGDFTRNELGKTSTWQAILGNFWLAVTDPKEWERQDAEAPATKVRAAQERARQRYERLRAKTAAAGRRLGEHGRIALASCVSANGFTDYNEDEAAAVKNGTFDSLDAARLPWQSFATDLAPKRTGRGVCRDYAAVARDFLRAMGVQTRVVGSVGHAMTEVTLAGKPLLFEPQRDGLNGDCVLYRYAP